MNKMAVTVVGHYGLRFETIQTLNRPPQEGGRYAGQQHHSNSNVIGGDVGRRRRRGKSPR